MHQEPSGVWIMAYTAIDDPSAHFQTATYTGTGSGFSITNDGNSDLKPDFVWVKDRSATNDHKLTDSSRLSSGNPTITLESNTNAAEYDDADPAATTSFNTDGFTIGTNGNYNTDDNEYVAWQWKANGGSLTTNDASATSVGDQDSVYQANTTAGFSIVTWSGSNGVNTMAHGLGAVPNVIIIKARVGTEAWGVYHHKNTSAPETDFLRLDTTAATSDSTTLMNDTAPTSTIFTVGDSGTANEIGKTYVSYQFAEKQGYSKFGSYTGNSNADGTFVYTGFKPAFFMVKATNATENWLMVDNKRTNSFNAIDGRLIPNSNAAEETNVTPCDFVSNGVKFRYSDGAWNSSSNTYIYMAFAEQPFVTSGGVPCTAR